MSLLPHPFQSHIKVPTPLFRRQAKSADQEAWLLGERVIAGRLWPGQPFTCLHSSALAFVLE